MVLTPTSTIIEILQENPNAGEIFARFGMGCVGCAIGRGETVTQAAQAHDIPLSDLLSALGIEE